MFVRRALLRFGWLVPALAALSLIPLTAAARGKKPVPLRIGATAIPHAEMIRAVIPELRAQGIEVEIKIAKDYSTPNLDVADGRLDANFFQNKPYLWRWQQAHQAALDVVGEIHIEPMLVYSRRAKLDQIVDGGAVAIPEDPFNRGRALLLLQEAGIIKLDAKKGIEALIGDITDNPHHLHFRQEPAQRVAAQLGSTELVVINGNFALQAKLKPEQALAREKMPFPNVVVARPDHKDDPRIRALVKALKGPTEKQFLSDHYAGAVVLQDDPQE